MVGRDPPGTEPWLRLLSRLPWWPWVLAAGIAYLGLHRLSRYTAAPGQAPGTELEHLGRALAGLGQWLVPLALLAAAALGARQRHRAEALRQALAADPVGTALGSMGRGEIEALAADVLRRLGFEVEETLASPGGTGTLLLLTSPEGRAIAQVRHWQAWRVGAGEVQGLIAAMKTFDAARAFLVVPGELTRDARRLAEGRPIDLIDGARLSALAQAPPAGTDAPPTRPGRAPSALLAHGGWPPRPGPWLPTRLAIPVRPLLRLTGVLLAAAAIVGGFRWIIDLPDKRLAPPDPPRTALAAPLPKGPSILIPAPPAPVRPPRPPAPAPVGPRSAQDIETAFEAFYTPPPGCASPGSRTEMVECANHRIRARRGYMAAGTMAEVEQAAPNEDRQGGPDGYVQGETMTWDDEGAIDVVRLAEPDRDDDADATEEPAQASPPRPIPPEKSDPEATYAPYDPKAPWIEP
jgi:restriction system protein